MIRHLIAFDIDGTLLNSKGEVLPSTLKAIESLKKQGHLVILATGRSYTFAKAFIETLHFDDYLLTNGAVGFLNQQVVFEKNLNQAELMRFDTFCKSHQIPVVYQNPKETYRNTLEQNTPLKTAMASFRQPVPPFKENFLDEGHINQAIAFYDASFDKAFEKENFDAFDFVRWHSFGVDILPKGNSKAKGLLEMAGLAGIDVKNTVAFGDGLNDCEMLQAAGTGVVMGNASEIVQACGDFVTTSNDEDGIFKGLEKLGLI